MTNELIAASGIGAILGVAFSYYFLARNSFYNEFLQRRHAQPNREEHAKAIYNNWQHYPGWVPWVEDGNSNMQDEARRAADLRIAEGLLPPVAFGNTPTPQDESFSTRTVIADNGLPQCCQYVLCFEGDSNGVILCCSRKHLCNVLEDTFGMMDGGDEFIKHALDPANWNDHFGDTGPIHYQREVTQFSPQAFDLHIWRVSDLES